MLKLNRSRVAVLVFAVLLLAGFGYAMRTHMQAVETWNTATNSSNTIWDSVTSNLHSDGKRPATMPAAVTAVVATTAQPNK